MKYLKIFILVLLLSIGFQSFAQNWTYTEYARKELNGKVIFLLEYGLSDKVQKNGYLGEGIKWRFTNNSKIAVGNIKIMRRNYSFESEENRSADDLHVNSGPYAPGTTIILQNIDGYGIENNFESVKVNDPIVRLYGDFDGSGSQNNNEKYLNDKQSDWNLVTEHLRGN